MIIEAPISLAIGWYVLSLLGSEDAPFDFALEKLVVIPVGFLVMMLIHLLWSWTTAPRRLYYEQQKAIERLSDVKQSPLRLSFDPKENIEWTEPDKTVCWVTLDIANNSGDSYPDAVVLIKSIEPLTNKREFRKYLSGWNDVPMRLTSERTLRKSGGALPSKRFAIYGEPVRFDLLVWKNGRGNPDLFHSNYTLQEVQSVQPGITTEWKSSLRNKAIPFGRIVVNVEVRTESGKTDEMSIELSMTPKTIRVKPQAPCIRRSHFGAITSSHP